MLLKLSLKLVNTGRIGEEASNEGIRCLEEKSGLEQRQRDAIQRFADKLQRFTDLILDSLG